jgi:hypothetical protein
MIIDLGDEIPAGMQYVSEELRARKSACWVGRGPAGFALLTAAERPHDVSGGRIIAISLTPALLRKLHARIGELLGEQRPPPIDGIKLGEPIGGSH